MSGTVDDEVVRMRFDNNAFERGVTSTLGLLDKLKQSLSFGGAGKGLEDLENKANKFNLSGMNNQVDESSRHWDLWHTAALVAFGTVVHQAVIAGERVVKAFTLDPVNAGFHNYETQINAVQTILANTGLKGAAGLEQVNKVLGDLNEYANQTVYNFSDMAKNIGTFTAAGVKLQPATDAIKGIANLAALSGSTAEQAGTAMYQLSQAIAANKVGLQDWNSVVNAGMGGKVFQKALFDTAKQLGTIKNVPMDQTFDQWTKAGHSFRNSLQEGWITGDVLTKTLSQFTGDLTDAQLKSMGYNAEQIKQIQEMAKTAVGAATKIKTLTQLQQALKEEVATAYGAVFKTIFGDINGATKLFTSMHNVLQNALTDPIYHLNTILETAAKFGARTSAISAFTKAFHLLGDAIKPIKQAFRDIFPPMTGERLANIINGFDDLISTWKVSTGAASTIRRIFSGIFALFDIGFSVVKAISSVFAGLFQDLTHNSGGLVNFIAHIADMIVAFDKASKATGLFGYAGQIVLNVFRIAEGIFRSFVEVVSNLFSALMPVSVGMDQVSGSTEAAGGALRRVAMVTSKISDWFSTLPQKIKPGIQAVINAFKNFGSMIAQGFNSQTFNNILRLIQTGLLAGIVVLIKRFLSNGLSVDLGGGFLGRLSEMFEGVTGNLKAMQQQLKAKALLEIAIAMGILAASMVALAQLNPTQLQNSLKAMAVGFGELLAAMGLLTKISGSAGFVKIPLMAAALDLLAGAILTLSLAVIALSKLSWQELERGLTAVGVLLAVISAATIPLSMNSGGMIRAALAIDAIAVAMNLLYVAVRAFATMSWGEMLKGLAGIGIALLGIAGAMQLMPKNMLVRAAAILVIAVAMNALYLAVKEFSTLSWSEMLKGLTGFAVALGLITIALNKMPPQMDLQALGLLAIAASLAIIAKAVKSLGDMSWSEIAKGLTALGGSLLILALGVAAMTGSVGGAVALTIVAAALRLLIPSLMALAEMRWTKLLKGIGMLAVIFASLAAAALLMMPVIPELLALGAALTLLSVAVLAFGAGAALLGVGLTAIAAAGGTAIGVLLSAIKSLIDMMPEVGKNLALMLVNFTVIIGQHAPEIVGAFVTLLKQLLEAIPKILPDLVTAIGSLVQAILKVLLDNAPQIIEAGFKLLMDLLQGIKDHIGEIVTTVADIIVNFLNALAQQMPRIVEAGVTLLFKFLEGVAKQAGRVPEEALKIVGIFLQSLLGSLPQMLSTGAKLVGKLIEGLLSKLQDVANAAIDLIRKFINTGLGWLGDLKHLGSQLVGKLIEGLKDLAGDIYKRAKELGSDIYHGIMDGIGDLGGGVAGKIAGIFTSSPLTTLMRTGGPSMLFADEIGSPIARGIAKGIEDNMHHVVDAITDTANVSITTMKKTITGLADVINNSDLDLSPTITPVLDLTQVQKDASKINGLLATSTISTNLAAAQASELSVLTVALADSKQAETVVHNNNLNLTQNNTSPEALSTIDIYRQTSNQLSLAKKALGIET